MRKGVNSEACIFKCAKYGFSANGTAGCVMDFWDSIVAWMGMGLGLLLSSVGVDSGNQIFYRFALRFRSVAE